MRRLFILIISSWLAVFIASEISAESVLHYGYKVGVNDILEIEVIDHNLKTVATVSSDGTISFPYLGIVTVKGLKIAEIEEEITKRLADGYIKFPVVTVSLIKSMSRKIYTYGELNRRGEFYFEENMTIMKALSLVGGISKDGQFGRLIVRRKLIDNSNEYKDMVSTELNKGFLVDRNLNDMVLQPDDILIVESNKTFLIEGEVSKRGQFVLEKDLTVLRALLQAGGVSADGSYGIVRLRRKNEGEAGGYKEVAESKINDGVIESREVEDMVLQPDDILIIERSKTFLIEGEILKRGRFVLEKDLTILRALLQAGGVSDNGLYGIVKLRRKSEGAASAYKEIAESKINDGVIESREVEDIFLQPDDILIVERNQTFLIEGEVSKRGQFILEKDLTVLRALLQAGGVSADGSYGIVRLKRKNEGEAGGYKEVAESKINDGAIESREVEDMVLQPDDILIIERNKTYFIYGEVNRTGEFVLNNNVTVFKAITIAGGFTKWGAANRVKILRPITGRDDFEIIKVDINKVINGDATADILLKNNDTIVISQGVF